MRGDLISLLIAEGLVPPAQHPSMFVLATCHPLVMLATVQAQGSLPATLQCVDEPRLRDRFSSGFPKMRQRENFLLVTQHDLSKLRLQMPGGGGRLGLLFGCMFPVMHQVL